MSLRLVKRLMLVLAAFAILSGSMASPVRAVAAQAGMVAADAGDECLAMRMHMPCPASKSSGPCKMAASDCARMTACCDSLTSPAPDTAAWATPLEYVSVFYGEGPAAFRGRLPEPVLFPPKAA